MLGSFGSAALYYLFAFVMIIWMVIKISRGSGLLAIATFFIWPLAIVSLVRNWGDKDTDIRIPFFACVLALGLSVFMVGRGVDRAMIEAAPYFSEDELAMIQAENPEGYAVIMKERERIVAEGGSLEESDYYAGEDGYYEDEDADTSLPAPPARPPATTAGSSSPSSPADTRDSAQAAPVEDPLLALPAAVAALSYRYASVLWPDAGVSVELPPRFRFLPSQRLHRLASLRSQPMPAGTLGWITHESVDLTEPDAWVLEARFLKVGHVPLGADDATIDAELATLAGVQQRGPGGRRLGEGDYAPQWDSSGPVLTWSLTEQDGLYEHRAALPLRDGVLLLVIRGLRADQREMGLRMTRLMANRVPVPDRREWRPVARQGDSSAAVSLLDWVGGKSLNGQPDGQ